MTSLNMNSSNQGIKTHWGLLAQIVQDELGIPEETVEDFLVFIDCHASLRSLTTIADNLVSILLLIEPLCNDLTLKTEKIPCCWDDFHHPTLYMTGILMLANEEID